MPFRTYLNQIGKELQAGNAGEHTHRPALKALLESLESGVVATNEPRRIDCGAPDLAISRGPLTIGYIEAKDVGRSLDEAERSDQIQRYLAALPNLILTDYLEFRWYLDGEPRASARLAMVGRDGKVKRDMQGIEAVRQLLADFLAQPPEAVGTPRDLALRMARLSQMTRDLIVAAFEKEPESGSLHGQYQAFRDALIPDLTPEQFADMYAQTIAYGLFAARCNVPSAKDFTREHAAYDLPKTNPFLRKLFTHIAGPELDDRIAWLVDDLAQVLKHADMAAVLEDFGKRTRREDPVVHFYETFLAAYDPATRVKRGVYYTPEPVVSYIVRSVDHLLKERFGLGRGLADASRSAAVSAADASEDAGGTSSAAVSAAGTSEDAGGTSSAAVSAAGTSEDAGGTSSAAVSAAGGDASSTNAGGDASATGGSRSATFQVAEGAGKDASATGDAGGTRKAGATFPRVLILDPAVGTATFLYDVVKLIHEKLRQEGQLGGWNDYVAQHLLPRLFGFELLMAPYAIAHLKLEMLLRETGYSFPGDKRLGIYLTNTLEEAIKRSETLFASWITEEANAAAQIKKDLPIMVVLGNPPYAGISANRGPWITELIDDYKQVDGQPLGERKHWLQDDYVKFIRFGQWRIERTGQGVLAYISNHGYLDNPTFRGMRQSLMDTFTDIYLLDLHGSTKKREIAPDGSKDQNVFDIQQGVAIGIFVKEPGKQGPAKVHHANLWGLRESKYQVLSESDIADTDWTSLSPHSPHYLFVPRDEKLLAEYEQGWKVTEIFPINCTGIVTARDTIVLDFEQDALLDRLDEFRDESISDERIREKYFSRKRREKYPPGDTRGWKLGEARQKLQMEQQLQEHIRPCLYRPFDVRSIFYTNYMVDWPRPEVMRHMLAGENVGLLWTRPMSPQYEFSVLSSRNLIDQCVVGNKSAGAGISYIGPLYLYPEEGSAEEGRRANLNPEFVKELAEKLGLEFDPNRNAAVSAAGASEDAGGTEASEDAGGTEAGEDASATGGEPTLRHRGYLPHWEAEGATYFITFRLADSLPRQVVETWVSERNAILKRSKESGRSLSAAEAKRLWELFSEKIEAYLDSGRGACWLQRPEIAQVVRDGLVHFDGERYRLYAWCIMPNHVHLVLQPLAGYRLADILHSLKSYTAHEANRLLGRQGRFWQREYYDHLIRDEEDFQRLVDYVIGNPAKTNLENWPWVWDAFRSAAVSAAGASEDAGGTGEGTFGPEEIFHYIYAILHSPTYRTRYAEFLKIDFPRVPLTSDRKLFAGLAEKGRELAALHLMESAALNTLVTTFTVSGSHRVEKVRYDKKTQRVFINKDQYFEGVPPQAWEFCIGGYQVCQKWLKDRKGRELSWEDQQHYQKIVVALQETIRLMGEIDALILSATLRINPAWPLK